MTRTPAFYPDAVTLVPDPPLTEVLSRVDRSTGCSIKDSFATLDLSRYGFRVLFQAQWIVHARPVVPASRTRVHWDLVGDTSDLAKWEIASGGGGDRPPTPIPAALVEDESVMVLAGSVGRQVVSGATLHRGDRVVGLSNFFADINDLDESWAGCCEFARSRVPALPLVGYESGDHLAAALGHGFDAVGPLQVWIADD